MNWVTNPRFYECIDCAAVNNIIASAGGAGIGLYSALNPRVLHNTVHSGAENAQTPLLLASVMHDPDDGRDTMTAGCKNVVLMNNIFHKAATARNGPMVQIRVHGLESEFVAMRNVYFFERGIEPGPFRWGHGAFFEDERTETTFAGNLTDWKTHMNGTESGSAEANPHLDRTYQPICGSATSRALTLSPPVTDDYNGAPRKSSSNIGASSAPNSKRKPYPPLPALASIVATVTFAPREFLPVWPLDHLRNHTPTTYVVARDGNDNNTGTVQKPFQTLAKAIGAAMPGDTIYIRNGTHTLTKVQIATPNLTISGYPGDPRPVLFAPTDGENSVLYIAQGGNYGGGAELTLRNLIIQGGQI